MGKIKASVMGKIEKDGKPFLACSEMFVTERMTQNPVYMDGIKRTLCKDIGLDPDKTKLQIKRL